MHVLVFDVGTGRDAHALFQLSQLSSPKTLVPQRVHKESSDSSLHKGRSIRESSKNSRKSKGLWKHVLDCELILIFRRVVSQHSVPCTSLEQAGTGLRAKTWRRRLPLRDGEATDVGRAIECHQEPCTPEEEAHDQIEFDTSPFPKRNGREQGSSLRSPNKTSCLDFMRVALQRQLSAHERGRTTHCPTSLCWKAERNDGDDRSSLQHQR